MIWADTRIIFNLGSKLVGWSLMSLQYDINWECDLLLLDRKRKITLSNKIIASWSKTNSWQDFVYITISWIDCNVLKYGNPHCVYFVIDVNILIVFGKSKQWQWGCFDIRQDGLLYDLANFQSALTDIQSGFCDAPWRTDQFRSGVISKRKFIDCETLTTMIYSETFYQALFASFTKRQAHMIVHYILLLCAEMVYIVNSWWKTRTYLSYVIIYSLLVTWRREKTCGNTILQRNITHLRNIELMLIVTHGGRFIKVLGTDFVVWIKYTKGIVKCGY